jgi:flagellar biosynthesis/type III secretory pathway protein FliH
MKRRPVYKFIETDGDEEPQEPVFWRDGYNEGYRQGYAEGRDAGRQEAKALPGEHLFHYVIEN